MLGQMQKFIEPYNQFSEHDEQTLTELVSHVKDGIMCEIGCWTGHSTAIIAKHAKEIGSKFIVIDNFKGNNGTPLLDFAKENSVKDIFISNMKEEGLWDSIQLLCMDSDEAHKYIGSTPLSFLFVDAGHTYTEVKNDLKNYKDKVLSHGIICGHDYESDTYDEAHIDEDYVNGKHHGVIKAVNEIFGKVEHEGRMWWKR